MIRCECAALPEVFGNYRLEAVLGRGGTAEVYRARVLAGPHADETVALKRLLPAAARDALASDLFICEADITRYLSHPNLLKVLDTGYVGAAFYVATEYFESLDLERMQHLAHEMREQLTVAECCFIAHEVALALEYAHQARSPHGVALNIVHCDLSPANVIVGGDGSVRLTDFGVARAAYGSPLTDNMIAGKERYLAPELAMGEIPTAATDVFATGVILYDLLTGFHSEARAHAVDAQQASRNNPRFPLRNDTGFPRTLLSVVEDALADKRAERIESASEFARALAAALPEYKHARQVLGSRVSRWLEELRRTGRFFVHAEKCATPTVRLRNSAE